MKHRLTLAYLLNLFDLYCTMYWVDRFGIGIEANPFMRWAIRNGSIYAIKIGAIGAILFGMYHCLLVLPKLRWISWLLLAVYGALAIYHIILLMRGGS